MQIDDVVRVTYWMMLGNQAGLNVRWYRCTGFAGSAPSDQQAADWLSTAIAPKYKNCICSEASYYGLALQNVGPIPKPDPVYSREGTGVGVGTGGPLPSNVAGIFTVKTGAIGRGNRGRCYVPFPSETDNTLVGGLPCPSAGYMVVLGILAAYHSLPFTVDNPAGGAQSYDLQPVIMHRTGVIGRDATGATARQKWATQHRRGSYGRPNVPPF